MSQTPSPSPSERPKKPNRSYWLRQVRYLGLVLLVVYGALVLLVRSPLYEAIVLRPSPVNENYAKARQLLEFQEYFIPCPDGHQLHAWLFTPGGARTLVIVHHGNAGNITNRIYLAKACIACGSAALLYDYRGYGKSSGKPRLAGLVDDGLCAYDFARTKLGYTPEKIVNFGESIGTGVACRVSSLRPSAGLVLQSAIGSLPRVAQAGIAWLNVVPAPLFPLPHLDNVEQIKHVRVPLLMFHGTADHVVPFEHSKLILANYAGQKKLILISQAGHNDMPAEGREYRAELCQFLKSCTSDD